MILLTVTHTMESILQQLTEMDVSRQKRTPDCGNCGRNEKRGMYRSMDMVEKCVKICWEDIFKEIDMWNNLLLGGQK